MVSKWYLLNTKMAFAVFFCLFNFSAFAITEAGKVLSNAIRDTSAKCAEISESMAEIKKMLTIGTAANAVGTAAGIGGQVASTIKLRKDAEVANAMRQMNTANYDKDKLQEMENSEANQNLLKTPKRILVADWSTNLDNVIAAYNKTATSGQTGQNQSLQQTLNKAEAASEKAGMARTGLFAVDTATSVAGALTASKVTKSDFTERIQECVDSLSVLRNAKSRVAMEDGDNADQTYLSKSQRIIEKCGQYETLDLSKLTKLSKGAMITNSVGSVLGGGATATSVLGNERLSDMAKQSKPDTVAKDAKKWVAFNLASGALGAGATVTSLTGTALNAAQIKTAKKALEIAQECEEALQ